MRNHYNIYYALVQRNWSTLDRWLSIQFGDASNGSRVCIRCVGAARESIVYNTRAALMNHMLKAHPIEYHELVREHSQIKAADGLHTFQYTPSLGSVAAPQLLQLQQTSSSIVNECAATAAASSPAASLSRFLARDAPPSNVDSEYWTGHSSLTECPRGCNSASVYGRNRRAHYKKKHYNIYYALVRNWSTLERWLSIQFGDALDGLRVCVRCVGAARESIVYNTRTALMDHMLMAHPIEYHELVREHSQIKADDGSHTMQHTPSLLSVADPQLLQLQQTSSSIVNAGAAAAEVAAASPAAALAPVIARDAPPSNVDSEYWSGQSSFPKCPRGCNSSSAHDPTRRAHYKKYHYNIYYALVQKYRSPMDLWLYKKFGDFKDSRVCLACEADRRLLFYPSRVHLIIHMKEAHPSQFLSLVREYLTKFNGCIHDAHVHAIMMKSEIKLEPVTSDEI